MPTKPEVTARKKIASPPGNAKPIAGKPMTGKTR